MNKLGVITTPSNLKGDVGKILSSTIYGQPTQAPIANRYPLTLDPSLLDSGISSLGAQSVKRRRLKENGTLEGTDRDNYNW